MLRRPLQVIAWGALLGSQQVAQRLLSDLVNESSPLWCGLDTQALRIGTLHALIRAMDEAWPRRFRLNELQRAGELTCPRELFSQADMSFLDQAFDSLMQEQSDGLVYRVERVLLFASLASEIDPALVVGWHLAKGLSKYGEAARRKVEHQPITYDPIQFNQDVADNHVHLGGVSAHDFVLARHLLEGSLNGPPEIRGTIIRLRELLALFLMPGEDGCLQTQGGAAALRRACRASEEMRPPTNLEWQWLAESCATNERSTDDWLRVLIAKAALQGDMARAWLNLTVLLWFLYQQSSTPVSTRVAIYYFFTELMVLRRAQTVDGQGLRRFTTNYYNHPVRSKALDNQVSHSRDSVSRLFVGNGDVAELKIAPGAFKPKLGKRLAEAVTLLGAPVEGWDLDALIPQCTPWTAAVQAYVQNMERWHLCAHFIRGAPSPQKGSITQRKELWQKADEFLRNARSQSGWDGASLLDGAQNAGLDFHPGRWIRGLDVAGDETAGPIERYAPQLRWLRERLETTFTYGARDPRAWESESDANACQPDLIHLSVHAGEDYDHPLSGLRHIDETVLFCGMREGDRLGHALALGIKATNWMEQHGDVLLPVDQHLDNLVWCWHYACELSQQSQGAAGLISSLQARIVRFSAEVNWASTVPSSPRDLFKAWELRKNCSYLAMKSEGLTLGGDKVDLGVPDRETLEEKLSSSVPVALFQRRVAEEWSPTSVRPKLVLVRAPGSQSLGVAADMLEDEETRDSLTFLTELQDYLLGKYCQQGLWIETNPTSNLYISRIEQYADHPIFRWNPPCADQLQTGAKWNKFGLREGPMQVLINTDDPGIMPTSLRMELALIEAAALELGYAQDVVTSWIEEIRKQGLRVFKKNHRQVFKSARDIENDL